jgi:hypothetical protein
MAMARVSGTGATLAALTGIRVSSLLNDARPGPCTRCAD